MKNVKLLIEREDIHSHVRDLWKTDIFRASHDDPNGFIHKIIEQYADLPRFRYEPTDEYNETAHFTSWWGGLETRKYDNDYIHDLYKLHEIYHTATMVYIRGMQFDNFLQKLIDNELGASVCSEIQVYFELPGLRDQTFKQRIFADRFLESPYYQKRFLQNPARLIEELKIHRRNVMNAPLKERADIVDEDDLVEFWIRKFADQNTGWGSSWVHSYNKVETAMADLRDDCEMMGRAAAMHKFMDWLQSPEITKPEKTNGDIPFPNEARAFAGIYWLNKDKYVEDMKGETTLTTAAKASFSGQSGKFTPA